jgi:glycine cleavage system aminomethyltransferase T
MPVKKASKRRRPPGFSLDCRRAFSTGKGAFNIEIIGEQRKATIIVDPPFDPKGERMRS